MRLASDERCGELARITAVQVCGRMGAIEIVPTALELAHNTGSIPLSIAAIATLGDVGGLEVRADLQKVARGDNTRLQTPAQGALLRLNRRLGL